VLDGQPWVVLGPKLLRWTPGGYSERRPRSSGRADVITPPTSLRVITSGWTGDLPLIALHGASAVGPGRRWRARICE